MEMSWAIFLGILFSIIVCVSVNSRIFLFNRKIEFVDWFLISLAVFNGVGFGFVIWATLSGYNTLSWTLRISQIDIYKIVVYVSLNIVLACSVMLGWMVAVRSRKKCDIMASLSRDHGYAYPRIASTAWITLLISFGAYLLYTQAYGGFSGVISYSRLIRSGIFPIDNKYSFLQRFGGLTFFSSFLFFALCMDNKTPARLAVSIRIGLLLSFSFSMFVLYTWVGRVAFVIYLVTIPLGFSLYKNRSVFRLSRKVIFIATVGAAFIILVDRLLQRSAGMGMVSLFTKELSFPIASFIVQFEIGSFRWFSDVVASPLFLLPQRIWGNMFGVETASMVNTIAFSGVKKGESGLTGSVPVDLLTFAYMQASVFGVVVVGFTWGFLLSFARNIMCKIPIRSVRAVLEANMILNLVVLTVLYGDPLHIIQRNFYLIVCLPFLAMVLKYKTSFGGYTEQENGILGRQ